MGGKAKAPPPPDYTPIANASSEQARLSYQLGQDQLQWAKDQYAQDSAVTNRVVDSFLNTQDAATQQATADRARYEGTFQPLEDQLVNDAESYASGSRKDFEIGRAQSAVSQNFEGQRQAALQNLEGFGIDPSSTRFQALDIGTRTQQAAASAAAGTNASQKVDDTARALRSEAINVGKGYPGQIAQEYATSQNAGNSAVQNTLSQTASGASTMGTGLQWNGNGNQALGIWSNALTQGYNNQLNAYKASQSSSSGWGSALGLVGGLLTAFSDGGDTDPAAPRQALPVTSYGGTVPAHSSPTGGQAIDDVPAKLTAGEFVVPKDVVEWYGKRHMYSLVEKAKKEQQEMPERSGAIPTAAIAAASQPAFVSRSALPVG